MFCDASCVILDTFFVHYIVGKKEIIMDLVARFLLIGRSVHDA